MPEQSALIKESLDHRFVHSFRVTVHSLLCNRLPARKMSSFTRLPKGSTVLVTGATGLIGSAAAEQLLEHGYEVVGITRDVSKTTELVAKFDAKYGKGHFRPVAVKDFTSVQEFQTALKGQLVVSWRQWTRWLTRVLGVAGVLHIATDSSFSTDPKVVIEGTVDATLTVLKAAAATPSVKAVVLTSSSVTIWMPESGKKIDASLEKYDTKWTELAYSASDDDPAKAVYCCALFDGLCRRAVLTVTCPQMPRARSKASWQPGGSCERARCGRLPRARCLS